MGVSIIFGQTAPDKWYLYSTNIGLGGISDLEPWLTSLATELVGRLREEIFEATSVGAGWDTFQSKEQTLKFDGYFFVGEEW